MNRGIFGHRHSSIPANPWATTILPQTHLIAALVVAVTFLTTRSTASERDLPVGKSIAAEWPAETVTSRPWTRWWCGARLALP